MALWRYIVVAFCLRNAVSSNHQQGIVNDTNIVNNTIFSLEVGTTFGEVGNTIVFYISFVDGVFTPAESTFEVTLIRNNTIENVCLCTASDSFQKRGTIYKKVQTFSYLFETDGVYSVSVVPKMVNNVSNITNMSLTLQLDIHSAVENECLSVGTFLIDKTDVSPFPDTTFRRKKLSEWTEISRVYPSCDTWRARKSSWKLEKIHMRVPLLNDTPQCLNVRKIRQVNIDFYTSRIIHIPLPGLGRESGFVIQPFMLPPGYYRICNTVSNNGLSLIHCGLLALVPEPNDCKPFENAMHIELTPEMDQFMWPLGDLTIKVNSYYSLFALQEAGYFRKLNYRYYWTCSGDVLCKSVQQGQQVNPLRNYTYRDIELTGQGTEVFIPRTYQTENTTVILTFIMGYYDPLIEGSRCSASAERIITFTSTVFEGVSIRCYLNCWKLVNPERPLLVGLSCTDCGLTQANKPEISWSTRGLPKARYYGIKTQFLTLLNIHRNPRSTFTVTVKVRYLAADKSYQEIIMGKKFTTAEKIRTTLIPTVDLIKESHESSETTPGDLAANFQRYDLSSFELFHEVAKVIQNPMVITITVLQQDAEDDYVLLRTIWAPVDFCIDSINQTNPPEVHIQLSTTDGLSKIVLNPSVYDLNNQNIMLDPGLDIQQLWLLTQDSDSFTVNDQTYLMTIARAIEFTASMNAILESTNASLMLDEVYAPGENNSFFLDGNYTGVSVNTTTILKINSSLLPDTNYTHLAVNTTTISKTNSSLMLDTNYTHVTINTTNISETNSSLLPDTNCTHVLINTTNISLTCVTTLTNETITGATTILRETFTGVESSTTVNVRNSTIAYSLDGSRHHTIAYSLDDSRHHIKPTTGSSRNTILDQLLSGGVKSGAHLKNSSSAIVPSPLQDQGTKSLTEPQNRTMNETDRNVTRRSLSDWPDVDVVYNLAAGINLTHLIPAPIKPLSRLVETVLDSMLSNDENQLSYSNINLYMASLIRMLRIREYTVPIVEKALTLLENAHELHKLVLDDPTNDINLIRLKLKAIQALTAYLSSWWNRNPTDTQSYLLISKIYEHSYNVLEDIPNRIPRGYPYVRTINKKEYEVMSFWIDPFGNYNNISVNMKMSRLIIDITALKKSPSSLYLLNTFLNVAVLAAAKPMSIAFRKENAPSTPVLHVSISTKMSSLVPFSVISPGLYGISFPFDFQSIKQSKQNLTLGVYSTKKQQNLTEESDCYFIRMSASIRSATLLTIKPASNVQLGVRLLLSNRFGEGINVIDEDDMILPTRHPGATSCLGTVKGKYSIFLPAVTLRQKSKLPGRIDYYIILRVSTNQTYTGTYVKPGARGLVEIGLENVTFDCSNAACLRYEGATSTVKDCDVSPCSGGVPSFMKCRCDQGQTFAADVTACGLEWFDVGRNQLKVEYPLIGQGNFLIPTVLVCLWLVFLILLKVARRVDSLERPLGKTLALEGVYNPTRSEQYLMCFVTGLGRGCGTKTVPYMTIIGTQKASPRYRLDTRDYCFVNGSEVWLMVSAPDDLGRPRRIILSLENEYDRISSWFVKEVYIRHITLGEEWTCNFNTWIPDRLHFDFPFAVENAIKKRGDGKEAFSSILLRLLRNQHPVFGITSNVPGSNYTKAQHVVLTFLGLFVLMWASLHRADLPNPTLSGDSVVTKEFKVDVDHYTRALLVAMKVVIPLFILGIFLENAKPLDSRNVEWRQVIKDPDDRILYKEEPELQRQSGFIQRMADTVVTFIGEKIDYIYSRKEAEREEHPCLRCPPILVRFWERIRPYICKIFDIPSIIFLAIMIAIIVCITYYLLLIGFYIESTKGLEYLYTVFVAFFMLMVLLYPLLLCIEALLNTAMYLIGWSYYGVGRDALSRIETISIATPRFVEVVKLGICDSRTKSLGDASARKLSGPTVKRSHSWCRQLILRNKAIRRNQIRYNNFEILVFIVLTILIINTVAGSVRECFLQDDFVTKSLGVGRIVDDPDKSITADDFWDHMMSIFSAIEMWKSNTSIAYVTVFTAVRLRQIRVRPYKGNCSHDFPDLIEPRCRFDIEHSVAETRNFANSWNIPTLVVKSDGFAYTRKADFTDVVTNEHRYPPRGYDKLLAGSRASPMELNNLRHHKWVDEHTRAVLISINVYNADSGLSTILEHTYEFRLTGIFMYTSQVYTFPLKLSQRHELLLSGLILMFALLTFYFLIFEIKSCFEMGFLTYFSFTQSWFLLVERGLSFCVVMLYVWLQENKQDKIKLVQELYIVEREDSVKVDFDSVSHQTFDLVFISSLLVVMCVIKVLLRFREDILMATFVNMIPSVAKLTLFPLLCIVVFANFGCLLFQSVVKYYYAFYYASYTVTILMLETSTLGPTVEASEVLGRIYIILVFSIMFYIVLNYFIVLLNDAYSDIKLKKRLLGTKNEQLQ